MSTKDQVLSSELHGEALLTARRTELQPLIDHLREVAQGRDDIRVECAGTIAGTWFSSAARRGEDLIAAGLLMLADAFTPGRPASLNVRSSRQDVHLHRTKIRLLTHRSIRGQPIELEPMAEPC